MKKFQEISNEDIGTYKQYLAKHTSSLPSDLYPHVLLSYQRLLSISRWYHDDICWQRDNYEGEEVWYPPIGKCTDYAKLFRKNVPNNTLFVAIPEDFKKRLESDLGDSIHFTRQPYLDDYILDNQSLALCSGRTYKSLRQSMTRFQRSYHPDIVSLKDLPFSDVSAFNQYALLSQAQHTADSVGIEHERITSEILLQNYYATPEDFIATALLVNHEIVAFCINELPPNTPNDSVGIYLKSNHEYKGAGTYLTIMDARLQLEKGIRYCNIMADEGNEQLKRSKLLLRPCKILHKYEGFYHR